MRSVFERLTDVRFYTGTSRFRFDELGNGRGRAGREDLHLQTGWAPAAARPTEVYASVLRTPRKTVIEPGTLGVQKFGTQAIPLKMVWLYRNGDACHKGQNFFVKAVYKDLAQLLRGVTAQLQPIAGPARRLYDQHLRLVTHLPQLVDGACVNIVQSFEIAFVVYAIFQQQYHGNIFVLYFLIWLQGLCGMAYGFLVSVVSTDHTMANIVLTGIFLPMMMLSGLMWPTEGMPKALRIVAKCLPFTICIESFRNISAKGWGLDNMRVLDGIGVTVAWTIAFGILSVYLMKAKR